MSEKVDLPDAITAAGRYKELERDRQPYLDRGRECAALTIPYVLPPQGHSASAKLATPYQSLGARGVQTITSKLLLSLFPGVPFFNYKMDDQVIQKMGAKRGEYEKALSSRERATTTELDTSVFRPAAYTALQGGVVCGNACLYIPAKQDERAQSFRLDQFVTRRDASGNLLEFVIHEIMDLASVPDYVRDAIIASEEYKEKKPLEKADVDLFTHGYLNGDTGKWEVYQEAAGFYIAGSEGSYKVGELPYVFFVLNLQPGEHYGRGYVEAILGDLDSLEALSEALVEGSVASARIVFLVNPGGTTSLQVVTKAKNGDVVAGDANDVTSMRVEKANDLSVAKSQAEEIGARLAQAFLLHSAVQRAGERVTAEEIRFMASELDDGLGGIYTLLAATLQLPCVRLFERRMEKRLGSSPLPKGMVQPVIVAGLEAIGRGHSQRNLTMFVKEIVAVLTPEIAMKYLKPEELIARSAAAYGIDTEGLLPSEDDLAQMQQQEQLMMLLKQFGPEAMKQGGGLAQTAMQTGATDAPPPQ
jgi:hypothetical protein